MLSRLENIEKEQLLTRTQLYQLTESITLARGGLRMLVVLGAIAASIVTIAASVWNSTDTGFQVRHQYGLGIRRQRQSRDREPDRRKRPANRHGNGILYNSFRERLSWKHYNNLPDSVFSGLHDTVVTMFCFGDEFKCGMGTSVWNQQYRSLYRCVVRC